jgi:hypothetical protein
MSKKKNVYSEEFTIMLEKLGIWILGVISGLIFGVVLGSGFCK